jgi:uncharacterized protein
VEDMYVAPVSDRQMEILSFGDRLYGGGAAEEEKEASLEIPRGDRSLAEAEGMGAWEERHKGHPRAAPAPFGKRPGRLSLDEARARARALRNKRDWEDQ